MSTTQQELGGERMTAAEPKWLRLVLLVLGFAAALLPSCPIAAAEESKEVANIDAAVIAAWTKRGAEAGWHGRRGGGAPLFQPDQKDLVDALPAFRFLKGEDLDLNDLPMVSVPFAIKLQNRQATLATLKGLVGLKNLARIALDVNGKSMPVEQLQKLKDLEQLTSIFWFDDMSPAQAKGLKGLTHLKWLYIQDTFMGNEALKELGGHPSLEYLGAIGTPSITAAGWKDLGAMPALIAIDITTNNLDDAVLREWKKHKKLASLNLRGSRITDAGLNELEGFEKLTSLNLSSTTVSDLGIKSLKGHKTLTALDLSRTRLTDAALVDLKELDNLVSLGLNGTQVTDAGLKDLKNLKRLTELHLGQTKVTNAGLKDLKELKSLRSLTLYYTGVTDEGIDDLKALDNLEKLDLNYTKVTKEGQQKLQDALPRLERRR